ncbi:hypothetical protein L195_g048108, partial [Trifolium pratense]
MIKGKYQFAIRQSDQEPRTLSRYEQPRSGSNQNQIAKERPGTEKTKSRDGEEPRTAKIRVSKMMKPTETISRARPGGVSLNQTKMSKDVTQGFENDETDGNNFKSETWWGVTEPNQDEQRCY